MVEALKKWVAAGEFRRGIGRLTPEPHRRFSPIKRVKRHNIGITPA
ncbi:MAG TPA: hypothetical protein PK880_04900 [Candidatus Competibacter sp.]|nr:hypothetical protein [Candidatus Competibacter sp.]